MPPEREQLLQFLSPEAAELVAADPDRLLAGRRLQASVLSCDLVSFRPRAEERPAEALAALRLALPALADVVYAHRGTLMSFPGDGVLAVFGAPIADSGHREAAEAARAELLGPALERVNVELVAAGLEPVAVEVAIASGPVSAGVVRHGARWEYVAIGAPTAAAIAATSG